MIVMLKPEANKVKDLDIISVQKKKTLKDMAVSVPTDKKCRKCRDLIC